MPGHGRKVISGFDELALCTLGASETSEDSGASFLTSFFFPNMPPLLCLYALSKLDQITDICSSCRIKLRCKTLSYRKNWGTSELRILQIVGKFGEYG